MKFICSLIGSLALLAIPTIAQTTQTSNYFPLEPGNVWMYALAAPGTTTSFRTISVEGRDTLNNIEYSRVRYFERIVHLRANTDGSIVSFNRTTNSEEAWLKLNEPVGTSFDARIDQCVTTGRVEERGAQVTTPAGIFDDTVRLSFQGSCADAGTTQQVYANGVGPVVHEETSFAGPRRYQLVYYRTGSETGAGPEQSFTIGLNALRYRVGTEMRVRLSCAVRSLTPSTCTSQVDNPSTSKSTMKQARSSMYGLPISSFPQSSATRPLGRVSERTAFRSRWGHCHSAATRLRDI
jgi:hypothetical protein